LCIYRGIGVKFEWDPNKSATNLRKHGVAFSDAVTVLDSDLQAITVSEEGVDGEERYITIGTDSVGRCQSSPTRRVAKACASFLRAAPTNANAKNMSGD